MFIAPFFLVFEILNIVFGYKKDDLKEAQVIIEADIADYRLKKGLPMRANIKVLKTD